MKTVHQDQTGPMMEQVAHKIVGETPTIYNYVYDKHTYTLLTNVHSSI